MALKNDGASVRARLLRMAQERHDRFEGLLVQSDALAHRLGISRASLVARGLKPVLAAEGRL